MTRALTTEKQLALISRAWGRQHGYAFFPWIDGEAATKEQRIRSFHEGPAFYWPRDKAQVMDHLEAHKDDDLYWCPSLFERKRRAMELAMDEHALWADLDTVRPDEIPEEYRPTVAWETSPGHFQALWLIMGGDMQGASWQGRENQRLTYFLGADPSGWDTTQLLRVPGWDNHKPEYRETNEGKPVQGRLVWDNGRRYLPDEFNDLPEVQAFTDVQVVLEDEIDRVDRHEVWGRVRLKVPHKARELFTAREVDGDRSERLWWLMRCLADAGCTATEIVALVRPIAWNKFLGRQDELKRLTIEASKAIAQRSEETTEEIVEELERKSHARNLFKLVSEVKSPEWIIHGILSVGACGFIAGQPKVYKSWLALDLILSVSTGLPFLDQFAVRNPGPVLYIQEEDSLPMVKSRLEKIWPSKQADKMKFVDGQVVWDPADPRDVPQILAKVREGVVISDLGWQSWLDTELERGYVEDPKSEEQGDRFRLVVIDPLMMVAGEVEENRAQEMTTKIFRPLKQLADKHKTAFLIVHHMRKGDPGRPATRGGQLMLGSVANHAWSEDSLYLRFERGGNVRVERESKHTPGGSFLISRLRNKSWTPTVTADRIDLDDLEGVSDQPQRKRKERRERTPRRLASKAHDALMELGEGVHATSTISEAMGVSYSGALQQLQRLEREGIVEKIEKKWRLNGTNGE